jgi:hypothetical protein
MALQIHQSQTCFGTILGRYNRVGKIGRTVLNLTMEEQDFEDRRIFEGMTISSCGHLPKITISKLKEIIQTNGGIYKTQIEGCTHPRNSDYKD